MLVVHAAGRFVRLAAFILFGFTPLLGATFAQAQSDAALRDEIERLREDLIDLQRFVFSGAGPAGSGAASADGAARAGSATAGAGNLNARIQLRIQQLEAQVRELTGRVEEASFQMRQVSQRLDKLVSDVDFRLQNLERAGGIGPLSRAPGGTVPGQTSAPFAGQPAPAPAGTTVISSSGASIAANDLPVAPGGELQPGQRPLAFMRQSDLDNPAPATGAATSSIAPEALARVPQPSAVAAPTAVPAPGAVNAQPTVASLAPARRAPVLPDGTPEEQYQFAFSLVRQQKFPEAEEALRAFINAHSEHTLSGNAMYWLGETFYAQQRFRDSAAVFVDAYSNYPKGSKASHSLLKLGMSLGELGKTDAACTSFQELLRKFPETEQRVLSKAESEQLRLGCKAG